LATVEWGRGYTTGYYQTTTQLNLKHMHWVLGPLRLNQATERLKCDSACFVIIIIFIIYYYYYFNLAFILITAVLQLNSEIVYKTFDRLNCEQFFYSALTLLVGRQEEHPACKN